MTDAVICDYIEDFHIEHTGQSFSLSILSKNARTKSRILISNLWTPILVGRTGRKAATELFKGNPQIYFTLSNTKYKK